jgi:hypothetical protein
MNNQKLVVIKSILVIAITVSVAGFALTQSLFRDTEKSEQSTFVVGTLDMSVDGTNGSQAENITVTNLGASGAQSGGKTWQIQNVGTLPGKLFLHVQNLINYENGCNDPEQVVDLTCDDPGPNQGELGGAIRASVTFKQGGAQKPVVSSSLATPNAVQFAEQWEQYAGEVIIQPGEIAEVTFEWSIEESSYQNEIQSDSVMFDIVFDLKQVAL